MRILVLGKRHYTNKDALRERFGRIYQLPMQWHGSGHTVELALLDYQGGRLETSEEDGFPATSLPLRDPRSMLRLRALARRFNPDVIVASGDCFVGLAALSLARANAARFIFDIYDDYRAFAAYRFFLGWDAYGYLLRHSDMALYASTALACKDAPAVRWHLVPNGVDPMLFRPIHRDLAKAATRMAASGMRWVGYFGGMDADRGVDDLIEAVGLLHARGERIRLVLCGRKRDGAAYYKPWVDFRGPVSHALIPDFINACDVVVLPYRRGASIDMASSCKIAEYLLCEQPLVATNTPNFTSNFPQQAAELGATLARPADPNDLARAILQQLTHPRILSRPNGHTWSEIADKTLVALGQIAVQN